MKKLLQYNKECEEYDDKVKRVNLVTNEVLKNVFMLNSALAILNDDPYFKSQEHTTKFLDMMKRLNKVAKSFCKNRKTTEVILDNFVKVVNTYSIEFQSIHLSSSVGKKLRKLSMEKEEMSLVVTYCDHATVIPLEIEEGFWYKLHVRDSLNWDIGKRHSLQVDQDICYKSVELKVIYGLRGSNILLYKGHVKVSPFSEVDWYKT